MTKKQKNKMLTLFDLILDELKNMNESAINGSFQNYGASEQAIIFALKDLKEEVIYD